MARRLAAECGSALTVQPDVIAPGVQHSHGPEDIDAARVPQIPRQAQRRMDAQRPAVGGGELCLHRAPLRAQHRHVLDSPPAGNQQRLFGSGAELTPERPLSQPGQFLCKERVSLVTSRGRIENVAVLGPERSAGKTGCKYRCSGGSDAR